MTVTAIKPAPKTATPKAGATGNTEAAEAAKLREAWNVADTNESRTWDLFKAADIAWQNARVIKVRVAYAAAMVKPVPSGPNKGQANLLNACRILFADPDAKPAERTKQAEAKKMTLRNYVDAGEALQEAGLATRTSEPDENERKIVADVFRAGNKRDKADKKAESEGQADDTLDGGNTPLDAEDEAVSFVHLAAHVAGLNNVFQMIVAGQVPISEREASAMADMLNDFQMKLSAYAEGK